MSSVGDVNQSPILSAQAPRSCCHNKAQPITLIAVGVIVVLGAIFLTLAANQVLPAGANPISNIGSTKIWYSLLAIGLSGVLFGGVSLYPKLEFTQQHVANAIDRLSKDLKQKVVITPGTSSSVFAYNLLTRMYNVQVLEEHRKKYPLFDENLHYGLLRAHNDLSHGIVQTLCALNSPEALKEFLGDMEKEIETILYHQIKHNVYQATLLPSRQSSFYFATKSEVKEESHRDENQDDLNKHWEHYAASEAFGRSQMFKRAAGKRSVDAWGYLLARMISEDFEKKLESNHERSREEVLALLEQKTSIMKTASIQGWVECTDSPDAKQSRKVWFRCHNNHFYLVNTANSEQQLLEFSNSWEFYGALDKNCRGSHFKINLFPINPPTSVTQPQFEVVSSQIT